MRVNQKRQAARVRIAHFVNDVADLAFSDKYVDLTAAEMNLALIQLLQMAANNVVIAETPNEENTDDEDEE